MYIYVNFYIQLTDFVSLSIYNVAFYSANNSAKLRPGRSDYTHFLCFLTNVIMVADRSVIYKWFAK